MATIICLAAARHRAALVDGWDVREQGLSGQAPFVLYRSVEGLSCLPKAAELLGIGRRYLRTVPVDDRYRMDIEALRAAITDERPQPPHPHRYAATRAGLPHRHHPLGASRATCLLPQPGHDR